MPIPLGVLAVAGAGAAGGVPAYEHIASTILSSAQSSVTFSSIPQTYRHLQIRAVVRLDTAVEISRILQARVNGSSSSIYSYHWLEGNGSSVESTVNGASQSLMWLPRVPAANAGTSIFAPMIIDILDYASTTKNKTIRTFGGVPIQTGYFSIILASGLFQSTAAIDSIEFDHYDATSSLVTGSRFSLYGIKG